MDTILYGDKNNKNKKIYNPDYYMVANTIETLNNRDIDIKYNFKIRK
jgi:hypothetical protein